MFNVRKVRIDVTIQASARTVDVTIRASTKTDDVIIQVSTRSDDVTDKCQQNFFLSDVMWSDACNNNKLQVWHIMQLCQVSIEIR